MAILVTGGTGFIGLNLYPLGTIDERISIALCHVKMTSVMLGIIDEVLLGAGRAARTGGRSPIAVVRSTSSRPAVPPSLPL